MAIIANQQSSLENNEEKVPFSSDLDSPDQRYSSPDSGDRHSPG
jgi:hypothetical protein